MAEVRSFLMEGWRKLGSLGDTFSLVFLLQGHRRLVLEAASIALGDHVANQELTYCVIELLRGLSFSVPPEAAVGGTLSSVCPFVST